jgi:hypothetical protein
MTLSPAEGVFLRSVSVSVPVSVPDSGQREEPTHPGTETETGTETVHDGGASCSSSGRF